ncbi:flagellar type III secretion system protein FlhB [Nioella sp. MMSF_3534]|uniref:flagellar type III secretion system protein FlhB n=1 Tax=Nioella sp. MMSF_3534 TaxID=3046720 RepID=UPI00273F4E30|nr:flagellar type III secretion system protein FlhB [Nioella sp. MMSF_3534]
MSDATSPDDKPYDPTPARLEEARKKGEIVRSSDLNTAVVYGGFLLALALLGPSLGAQVGQSLAVLLDQAPEIAQSLLTAEGQAAAGGILSSVAPPVAAVIVLPGVLLILALFAQRAILFTPSRLQPKLSRISILSNAKNKFGANGLFEFAKAAAKLTIYSGLLAWVLWSRRDRILAALFADSGQILSELGQLMMDFLMAAFGLALVIALADYMWQVAAHHKKHRMSRQELVDETKTREGDPHVKQQRRERGTQIAMNKMLKDVPAADVIVVNPTHYAVALKWDRDAGEVPVCVAKGADEVAARIREVAAEHGVPVYSDPPTARALFAALEIGQGIAPDHYRAVAAAIRFADRMRGLARARR